ncbi:LytTR family DNA-binding domain-containing protein [Maricaulis sp.]|uniref:LytTR family DNA-binding domain-containing protein n=1 Tax=Maricaulis sp. TaxID=1486257 RepID=UPI0026052361|nr:LytTR family DNA-binding domain-containing protein [Maricaulis sp.]
MSHQQIDRETRAERVIARGAMVMIATLMIANYIVNSTSIQMEAERAGREIDALQPWFIEGTSMALILALMPALVWLERRYPLVTGNWAAALPFHAAGLLVFSILHVGMMGLLRETLHPILFDRPYVFFNNPVEVFLYELRKDALTYSVQILTLSGFRIVEWARMDAEAAREEARRTHRLTLKCGGRTLLVEADAFQTAKAAGNYVELTLASGEQMARMTLSELERQLREAGVDAVRVHRSWLVNRSLITEITPTGEGDVTLTLSTGARIPGSRRYREKLAA